MTKLKTPKFVDTIEDRAQRAFSKVKGDVDHIGQEQVVQNKHIEELYSLLKQLEQYHSTTITHLQSLEKEYGEHLVLQHKEDAISDKDLDVLRAQIEENAITIEFLKEQLNKGNDEVLVLIAKLRDEFDAQKLDVAKEILHQFAKIREEFLVKEKLMYKEVKEELALQIRKDLKEDLKKEVLDELQLNFVKTDEYALKIREILQKLKEAKAYVHEYTASQVGIVQQQVEMLKELLNSQEENDAQGRMVVILDTLTQKVEELDDKVNNFEIPEVESQDIDLSEIEHSLKTLDSRVVEVENTTLENNEKIEILDNFLEQEVEEKLIPQVSQLRVDVDNIEIPEVESQDIDVSGFATKDDIEEVKELIPEIKEQEEIDTSLFAYKADLEVVEKNVLNLQDQVTNLDEVKLESVEVPELDDLTNQINEIEKRVDEIDGVEEVDIHSFATKDELATIERAVDVISNKIDDEVLRLDDVKANKDDIENKANLEELDSIKDSIDELEKGINEIQEAINNIEIPEIKEQESVDLSSYALRDEVSVLADKIEEINSDLDTLDKDLTEIDGKKVDNSRIEELKEQLQELDDEVKAIVIPKIPEIKEQEEIDTSVFAQKNDVEELKELVDKHDVEIETLDKDLTQLDIKKANVEDIPEIKEQEEIDTSSFATKDDIEEVKESIDKLDKDISILDADKLDKVDLDELKEVVENIEIPEQINIKELEEKVDEVNLRAQEEINILQQNLDEIKQDISLKEDSELVQEKIDEVKELIENVSQKEIDTSQFVEEASFEKYKNEIEDKMSRIDEKINEIESQINDLEDNKVNREEVQDFDSDEFATTQDLDELIQKIDDLDTTKANVKDIPQIPEAIDSSQFVQKESIEEEISTTVESIVETTKEKVYTDLNAQQAKIDDLIEKVEQLEENVSKEQIEQLEDMYSEVEKLKETIDSQQIQIDDLAKLEDLSEEIRHLEERVDKDLDELKENIQETQKEASQIVSVEEVEEIQEEITQTIEVMKKDLNKYVEFKEFEEKVQELEHKKLNIEDFDEYLRFNIEAREVYEKAYVELLARFHEANHTSTTKKEYQNEMNKAKKVISKFVEDESKRLRQNYNKDLVDTYEKHLLKSITRDSNYLRDSWTNLPINQGRDEAQNRAREVENSVKAFKEEDSENFFTWFAFNKK